MLLIRRPTWSDQPQSRSCAVPPSARVDRPGRYGLYPKKRPAVSRRPGSTSFCSTRHLGKDAPSKTQAGRRFTSHRRSERQGEDDGPQDDEADDRARLPFLRARLVPSPARRRLANLPGPSRATWATRPGQPAHRLRSASGFDQPVEFAPPTKSAANRDRTPNQHRTADLALGPEPKKEEPRWQQQLPRGVHQDRGSRTTGGDGGGDGDSKRPRPRRPGKETAPTAFGHARPLSFRPRSSTKRGRGLHLCTKASGVPNRDWSIHGHSGRAGPPPSARVEQPDPFEGTQVAQYTR